MTKRAWQFSLFLMIAAIAVPSLLAQSETEFDSYKVRVGGFWFHSNPSGDIEASNGSDTINLQKDLGFDTYSTFVGKVDWRFTRKNHLYLVGADFTQDRQHVLTRTITYQGQTFEVGLTTSAHLAAPLIAPGYQYDILRRKRGHLGIAVQIDLFNASAAISAKAQVVNGMQFPAVSASSSLLAPIPVAGPEARFYLTNSPRVFVEGNLNGMYLFGYGNFISTGDNIGVTINKHLSVNAGYLLGTRLIVTNNSSSNRIGIHLTQSGAIVGAEVSF
jgi:hypothetical protein